jgi:sulfate permease, SulP family
MPTHPKMPHPPVTRRFSRFRPRLCDALAHHYTQADLLRDIGAGLTVGVVALPLAMAFAIASGLKPETGLWTAIIAGFLIAALGGSTVQIGGPAGAFIVIVFGIVERYGVANLLIATACSGVILFVLGWLKLGTLVRYVPVTIVIGFTNGIAVLIAVSQIKDWLGLTIARMPGDFFSQISTIASHLHTLNPYAFALGLLCVGGLFLWPRLFLEKGVIVQVLEGRPIRTFARIPAPMVALVSLTLLAWAMNWPVETIGSRFGGIQSTWPTLALPEFSWATVRLLVAPTFTLAMLGAVESLLCARVADQLASDRPDWKKHDPNQELMAQGIANAVVPFFGGMPATGTIARTVTNLRSGAVSPIAGIVHAAALMGIVLLAAPLAVHIPLAVLAGILLFVAWNMGEWHEFARLRQFSAHYRTILLGTFVLTVVFDLTVAFEAGLVLACIFFVKRMSALFEVQALQVQGHRVDARLYGSLFFGAVVRMDALSNAVDAVLPHPPDVTLDCTHLISMDTTGLDSLRQLHTQIIRRGGQLRLTGLQPQPRSLIERSGFQEVLNSAAPHDQPASPIS